MKQATVIKWLSKTVYCYKCFAYAICKIFGLVIILMDKEKKQVPALAERRSDGSDTTMFI